MSREAIALRFARSAGAATFSQLWRVGVTLMTHLALRRLVPREDWGIFVWCEVIFLVLGALRDLGLNAHVLRVRPKPFGNLLLLEVVWGGGLAVLVFAGAPLIALGLSDPHPAVVSVLKAMTLFLFFEGLAAVPLMYFDGELQVRQAVPPEILRNLTYAVTAISLALAGHGVWSMVIAQVVASAVFAATLWSRAWGRIELHYARGQTLRLLASSYRLAVIWLLVLLVRYVDRLVLGARIADLETLATYEFAYWAAFIVPLIVQQPIGRVAFPTFIAFADSKEKLFDTYRLATVTLLALETPAAMFLFLNADTVLPLLGGQNWPGAPALLRVLCFAPLIDPFSRLGGEVMASRHRDRPWILATATTLASFTLFGVVFVGLFGAVGMAYANYLPLGSLVLLFSLHGLEPRGIRRIFGDLAWVYLLPVPGFLAAAWLAAGRPWLLFGLSLAAVALAGALYYRRFGADVRRFLRGESAAAGA